MGIETTDAHITAVTIVYDFAFGTQDSGSFQDACLIVINSSHVALAYTSGAGISQK
jgi:hypothetical protein